jgi:uncharacterized Fe-S cluster protein YjdI
MTIQSKEERILYIPAAGLCFDFLYVPEFKGYTKFVLIDLLPNSEDWIKHQNEIWVDVYNDNNSLNKLIKNLIDLFGNNYTHHKRMLSFKYHDGRTIEYYYNTNCCNFDYIAYKGNGVLFQRLNCVLRSDDDFLETIMDICSKSGNAYYIKCKCGQDECIESVNELIEYFDKFEVDYIEVRSKLQTS